MMQADILEIEILFSPKCRSHSQMATLIKKALAELGLKARISTREIRSKEEALKAKFFGSPTVKVNGIDLEPGASGVCHLA